MKKLTITILWSAFGLALATAQTAEERVLSNSKLRVHVRPNLTLSVEDQSAHVTWGSDPWENSPGRVHLRGKHGEAVTVNLAAASQKKFDAAAGPGGGDGLQISLSDFRTRMGPVRDDRDPGAHLSVTLQVLLAKDAPNLVLRIA